MTSSVLLLHIQFNLLLGPFDGVALHPVLSRIKKCSTSALINGKFSKYTEEINSPTNQPSRVHHGDRQRFRADTKLDKRPVL